VISLFPEEGRLYKPAGFPFLSKTSGYTIESRVMIYLQLDAKALKRSVPALRKFCQKIKKEYAV
jgi:hypothetical protein